MVAWPPDLTSELDDEVRNGRLVVDIECEAFIAQPAQLLLPPAPGCPSFLLQHLAIDIHRVLRVESAEPWTGLDRERQAL